MVALIKKYKDKAAASAVLTDIEKIEKKKMELEKVLSDSFTRMVWKRTLKVSFGIKGRWVYARYCTAEGNKGTVKEWQSNVEEDCVKDDVDVCF